MYVSCARAYVFVILRHPGLTRCSLPRSERMLSTLRVLDVQLANWSHFFSRVLMSHLRYPPSCVADSSSATGTCTVFGLRIVWVSFACVGSLWPQFWVMDSHHVLVSLRCLRLPGFNSPFESVSNVYVGIHVRVPSSSGFARSIPQAILAVVVHLLTFASNVSRHGVNILLTFVSVCKCLWRVWVECSKISESSRHDRYYCKKKWYSVSSTSKLHLQATVSKFGLLSSFRCLNLVTCALFSAHVRGTFANC